MVHISSHRSEVHEYVFGVMSGRIVAGELVRLAVRRYVKDRVHASTRGYVFRDQYADEAIDFIELCRHSKGEWAGEPLELAPWQKFIVWNLFGWRRKRDNLRRFRKAFVSVGRKNGKSTICAAIALLMMTLDNPTEHGAEIYTAATKLDQAKIIYDEAVRMRGASPSLRNRIRKWQAAMTIEDTACKFEPLGGDGDNLDGLNPHGMFLDELHAWLERHRDKWDKLTTGGGARRQPLTMTVTTAGNEKSVLWKEEDDFAVKVLESVETGHIISDTVFAFIARLDEDDDELDEQNWPKANPNIDISCKREYLQQQAEEAEHKPTARNSFKRYHGNVEVTSFARAVNAKLWAAGAAKLSDEIEPSYGGYDLGRSDDFAGIGMVTPRQISDDRVIYELRHKTYTCEDRPDSDYEALKKQWIQNGQLEEHSGDQIDYSEIEQDVVSLTTAYNVQKWWYDPKFATQLSQLLIHTHGIEAEQLAQTAANYNEALRSFLRELKAGNIWHDNCPCLTWQALNLVVSANHRDEWMPDKSHRQKKIDAMVAILMAYAQCIFSAEETAAPALYFG